VSHPDELPELFLDRSIKVPSLLRDHGLRLTTLAEHYGIPADESVADTEWLRLVGERNWIAFMKDDRIRYVPAERAALIDNGVRAFVITNRNLPADLMVQRIVSAIPTIAEICRVRSGPFLYAIQATRVDEIDLR
jgi:PIN like domain